jgi:hypothetical protein
MGIAMLTAIMAMLQISTGLTQQQIFSRPPADPYLKSVWQSNDQQFLRLIETIDGTWGSGSTLCQKIIQAVRSGTSYPGLTSYVESMGIEDLSVDKRYDRFRGACVLGSGPHRVLVAPKPSSSAGTSYRLYSCVLASGVVCSFEQS